MEFLVPKMSVDLRLFLDPLHDIVLKDTVRWRTIHIFGRFTSHKLINYKNITN